MIMLDLLFKHDNEDGISNTQMNKHMTNWPTSQPTNNKDDDDDDNNNNKQTTTENKTNNQPTNKHIHKVKH